MNSINDADAIYYQGQPVDKVMLNGEQVWPPIGQTDVVLTDWDMEITSSFGPSMRLLNTGEFSFIYVEGYGGSEVPERWWFGGGTPPDHEFRVTALNGSRTLTGDGAWRNSGTGSWVAWTVYAPSAGEVYTYQLDARPVGGSDPVASCVFTVRP